LFFTKESANHRDLRRVGRRQRQVCKRDGLGRVSAGPHVGGDGGDEGARIDDHPLAVLEQLERIRAIGLDTRREPFQRDGRLPLVADRAGAGARVRTTPEAQPALPRALAEPAPGLLLAPFPPPALSTDDAVAYALNAIAHAQLNHDA